MRRPAVFFDATVLGRKSDRLRSSAPDDEWLSAEEETPLRFTQFGRSNGPDGSHLK